MCPRQVDPLAEGTSVVLAHLGQWIHGDGRLKHQALPEFKSLEREHAAFHRAAADVVKLAHQGQKVDEQVAISGTSPFATASKAVVMAIATMRTKAK